jgi:outer membrane biosynthesis protein TonB
MSFAAAEPRIPPDMPAAQPEGEGVGRPGLALSAALHVVIILVLALGLPRLFAPKPPEEMPIAVQLVTIGPETRATHPNPYLPRPEAKPEPPTAETSTPKPEPKPEPPEPAPPPATATAPTTTPEPAPPQPEPPKPAEAKPSPPPPPEIKQAQTPPPPPPKPPEPKPEPPKAMARLEPPKPRAKPEPTPSAPRATAKTEDRKYDPSQFESLLKNLSAQASAPPQDAPPKRRQTSSAAASSQPRAPLGSQLTASEMDMVREQIARCWNVPAGARDAKDLVVEIRVAVNPDGTVQQATIVDQARLGSDPFFRAAAESARRAFFNPNCRPLHLPPEKYAIWKDLVVDFSPKDIL